MRDTFLPACRPAIDERDIAAVVDALRSGRLAPGPLVRAFESEFAARARLKHAVAVNGATAGLSLVLTALGVGSGDEVVVPALAVVAAANAVRHAGATPVFCDVEPDTLCASVRTIETVVTARTRGIVVMPYAGRPAHIAAIVAFARERGIAVVEDAASAVGMLDDGRRPGAQSDAAIYRFDASASITTGQGAMIATHDDALAERVRRLVLSGEGGDAADPGYDAAMSDLAAALGSAQLERFDALQGRREEIVAQYLAALESLDGVEVAAIGRIGLRDRHGWCFFPVTIDARTGASRDDVAASMRAAGIDTAVHYVPVHRLPAYRAGARDLPVTERVSAQLLSLPLFAGMTDEDVCDVVAALSAATGRVPMPA